MSITFKKCTTTFTSFHNLISKKNPTTNAHTLTTNKLLLDNNIWASLKFFLINTHTTKQYSNRNTLIATLKWFMVKKESICIQFF